jgi:protein tyrosine phosphatase (PTP) superfamily phosphohydrolase (DUF442 family)
MVEDASDRPDSVTDIYNFLPLSAAIATAGQPTREQFVAIQRAGYQVVINLALPSSDRAIADEEQLVQQLGMVYIAIPVLWEAPQVDDCDRFFAALEAHQSQAIFVHCAANMRVSAFMYLYRRLRLGVDAPTAAADLHNIWQPNPQWQAFIDAYLARAGAASSP